MEKLRKIGKRGNLNMIVPAILTLTLGAIILVFGLIMLDEVYTQTTGDEARNASNKTIYAMGKFGDYWDLIVLAIIIAIVISLLLVVFSLRRVR
jgi:type II secretory pathway component PulF